MSHKVLDLTKAVSVYQFEEDEVDSDRIAYHEKIAKVSRNFCFPQEPENPLEPERYRYNESPRPSWMPAKEDRKGR